jgi:DNA-binding NtrC family response regulator
MPCTVLVADDREDVRALVRDELADAGMTVVEAADGEEAWTHFRREHPQVVVTDLRMPRVDGLELLRRIRGISDVPVMLLTARGDVPTAVAAMKAGAAEFLLFPDALGGLHERVLWLADRRRTRGGVAARSKVTKLREQEQRRQCLELETVLRECGGNLASVARRLDLSRGAVFYRAQKFGMLAQADTNAAGVRARSAKGES